VVHDDRLVIGLRAAEAEEASDSGDGHSLSIPWQKLPSRKSRQIIVPHGIPKNEIRPTRIERRARLVNAIARGRRWLDEIVVGLRDRRSADPRHRQKCSARQVNMTISLAFLAPDLVRAASKAVCSAASESNDFVMLLQNGAGSSRRSD